MINNVWLVCFQIHVNLSVSHLGLTKIRDPVPDPDVDIWTKLLFNVVGINSHRHRILARRSPFQLRMGCVLRSDGKAHFDGNRRHHQLQARMKVSTDVTEILIIHIWFLLIGSLLQGSSIMLPSFILLRDTSRWWTDTPVEIFISSTVSFLADVRDISPDISAALGALGIARKYLVSYVSSSALAGMSSRPPFGPHSLASHTHLFRLSSMQQIAPLYLHQPRHRLNNTMSSAALVLIFNAFRLWLENECPPAWLHQS